MKEFLKWIRGLFSKKRYYEISYDNLNEYSIEFKEPQIEHLELIKNVLVKVNDATRLDDDNNKLYQNEAKKIKSMDILLQEIKSNILMDYRKTYFESKAEDWDFNYFLTSSKEFYKDTLLIQNRLSYPIEYETGDIFYPVLSIKKYNGYYFLWNMLDLEEESNTHSFVTSGEYE